MTEHCFINNQVCGQEFYKPKDVIKLFSEGYSLKAIRKIITKRCCSKIKNPCSFVDSVILDYVTKKS